jgi:hypothetical protein
MWFVVENSSRERRIRGKVLLDEVVSRGEYVEF